MSDLMLETITDNLANGYKRLEKGTFQEASEVQNQRRADHSLRNRWFYTANMLLARLVDGNLEFGLTGRSGFDAIAGEDIDEFTGQILHNEGKLYSLTPPQIKSLPQLGDVVWAKVPDLELINETDEWSYFLIDTSDVRAERLNAAQQPFAVKAHGSLESKYDPEQKLLDYGTNMSMLRTEGSIEQTRLWLPTPSHIMKYLKDGQVVARASRLYGFDDDSDFDANIRDVNIHDALRGVQIVGEADAQKIKEVADLLRKLTAQKIFAESLTPETIQGYENAGALYRQTNPIK